MGFDMRRVVFQSDHAPLHRIAMQFEWTKLFGELLEKNMADSHLLSVMLAHGCGTSTDMRALMQRAEATGVEPTVSSYTTLLGQLQNEGKPERRGVNSQCGGPLAAAGGRPPT